MVRTRRSVDLERMGNDLRNPRPSSQGNGERHVAEASSAARRRRLIRVAVVDDHAAVRLGLSAAIAARPGFVCVGVLGDGELIEALLYRSRPDVLILDYELPRINGLELCRRIKQDPLGPAVVLYSAYAEPVLTVPSLVAGVDGMVHKGTPARELFEAVRTVAEGSKHLPSVIPELVQATAAVLEPEDRPALDLLVRRMSLSEVAATLGWTARQLDERTRRILARLQRPVGSGVLV
jgi:DNA-binding NarL/FixJ family response regulator